MSDPIFTKTRSDVDGLLARSQIYQILAQFFRHPALLGDGFLNQERFVRCQEAMDSINSPNKIQLKNYFRLLCDAYQKTSLELRIRDYEFCFGYTASGPVPLYELEYGEEESLRQPRQLADIASFYRAFGLQLNNKKHERVDHVSTECEFIQYLLFKEAYALIQNQEENVLTCQAASGRFLSEHLGRWFPAFSSKLARCAQEGLMKHLADFAFTFVVQDCQALGISLGPFNLPIRPPQEKEEISCMGCNGNTVSSCQGSS